MTVESTASSSAAQDDTKPTTDAPVQTSAPAVDGGTPPAEGDAKGDAFLAADAKGDESKPSGETDGPAAGELEVTLPEGVEVDQAMLDGFKDQAATAKLNSEQASALAAWYAEQVQAASAAQTAAFDAQDKAWAQELQADPDIGGQKFNESMVAARQAIAKFGGPKLASELAANGVGNLPELCRAFVRIGREFAEDTTSGPRATQGVDDSSAEAVLAKMYPSSSKLDG